MKRRIIFCQTAFLTFPILLPLDFISLPNETYDVRIHGVAQTLRKIEHIVKRDLTKKKGKKKMNLKTGGEENTDIHRSFPIASKQSVAISVISVICVPFILACYDAT